MRKRLLHILISLLVITVILALTSCTGGDDNGDNFGTNSFGLSHAEQEAWLLENPPSVGEVVRLIDRDWQVIDRQGDNILLIMSDVYRGVGHGMGLRAEGGIWSESALRQDIQVAILNYFSESFQSRIVETRLTNERSPLIVTWSPHTRDSWQVEALADTVDRIFILSLSEILHYFGNSGMLDIIIYENDPDGAVLSDEFDEARKSDGDYLIRTPQLSSLDVPMAVNADGTINVNTWGTGWGAAFVRPAFWLNVGSAVNDTAYISAPPVVPHQPVTLPVFEVMQFGGYDWLVLETRGNMALIMTEQIIERRAYHSTSENFTWETSDIRAWLNNDFYNRFSLEDRIRISETLVINDSHMHWNVGDYINNTTDKIFLLSYDEVIQYFDNVNSSDFLTNNQFNVSRIAYDTNGATVYWWLRGHSISFNNGAPYVSSGGVIHQDAGGAYWSDDFGVRPALWVNLTELVAIEPPAIPVPTPEPIIAVSYPTQQQTFTIQNVDGYTMEVTVELGGWIRASEQDFLDGAWASLGGDINSAQFSSLMRNFTDSDPVFHYSRSALAFGRVTIVNVTEGFPVTESLPMSPTIWINANTQGLGQQLIDAGIPRNLIGGWAVYSSGLTNMYWAHGTHTINARMTRDNWGPIMIAFALDRVFTPNHPDGSPSIDDVTITFTGSGHGSNNWMHGSILNVSNAVFRLDRTWVDSDGN